MYLLISLPKLSAHLVRFEKVEVFVSAMKTEKCMTRVFSELGELSGRCHGCLAPPCTPTPTFCCWRSLLLTLLSEAGPGPPPSLQRVRPTSHCCLLACPAPPPPATAWQGFVPAHRPRVYSCTNTTKPPGLLGAGPALRRRLRGLRDSAAQLG